MRNPLSIVVRSLSEIEGIAIFTTWSSFASGGHILWCPSEIFCMVNEGPITNRCAKFERNRRDRRFLLNMKIKLLIDILLTWRTSNRHGLSESHFFLEKKPTVSTKRVKSTKKTIAIVAEGPSYNSYCFFSRSRQFHKNCGVFLQEGYFFTSLGGKNTRQRNHRLRSQYRSQKFGRGAIVFLRLCSIHPSSNFAL
jgi:hypothetical protein